MNRLRAWALDHIRVVQWPITERTASRLEMFWRSLGKPMRANPSGPVTVVADVEGI